MDEKAYRNMCIREGYDKGYEKAKKEYTDQLAAKDNQIAAKDNQISDLIAQMTKLKASLQ